MKTFGRLFQLQTRSNETMIKVPVGLAHDRGITPSTQAKQVHVFPECISLRKAPEKLHVEYMLKHLTNTVLWELE